MIDLRAQAQSGNFTTSAFSLGQTIAIGSSGVLLSVTAPTGKKVRLDSFSPASGANEGGVTLNVDGVDIVTNASVGYTGNAWLVGKHLDTARWTAMDDIIGNTITITKVAGSTLETLFYSYSFGE